MARRGLTAAKAVNLLGKSTVVRRQAANGPHEAVASVDESVSRRIGAERAAVISRCRRYRRRIPGAAAEITVGAVAAERGPTIGRPPVVDGKLFGERRLDRVLSFLDPRVEYAVRAVRQIGIEDREQSRGVDEILDIEATDRPHRRVNTMLFRPMQRQACVEGVYRRFERAGVFDPRRAMHERTQLNQRDIIMVSVFQRLFPWADTGLAGMAGSKCHVGPLQLRQCLC